MVTPYQRVDLFSPDEWLGPYLAIGEGDWRSSENTTADEADARSQYAQLLEWETAQSQPIRNVKLERREPGPWITVEGKVTA